MKDEISFKKKIVTETSDDSGITVSYTEIDLDYQIEYVAFLDVLGFREMVKSHDPTAKQKLKNYFEVVNYWSAGANLESIFVKKLQ